MVTIKEKLHYDRLLWVVTSIFLIPIIQLLSSPLTLDNIESGFLGLLIICCLLYFAVSFRNLKHDPPNKKRPTHNKKRPRFPQWEVYIMLFFAILVYGSYRIIKVLSHANLCLTIFWLHLAIFFWLPFVVILYYKGLPSKGKNKDDVEG